MREKGHFYHGTVPKECFSTIPDESLPTGLQVCGYRLKPGKSPTEALKSIRKGVTFFGCGQACSLAYYEALKTLFGEEKFNALFSQPSTLINISDRDKTSPLVPFFMNTPLKSFKEVKKGQLVHILGINLYQFKHLNGEAGGFNVFCSEEGTHNKFVGLGLNAKGETHKEITELLCREYNKNPIGMEIVTDEVAKRILGPTPTEEMQFTSSLKNHTLSVEEFIKRGGGGNPGFVCDFNMERVQKLAQASIDEGCKLLASWMSSGK